MVNFSVALYVAVRLLLEPVLLLLVLYAVFFLLLLYFLLLYFRLLAIACLVIYSQTKKNMCYEV